MPSFTIALRRVWFDIDEEKLRVLVGRSVLAGRVNVERAKTFRDRTMLDATQGLVPNHQDVMGQ